MRDGTGSPIAGAWLTWTLLDLESALPILATTAEQRFAIADSSRTTRTLEDGSFAFDSPPQGAASASVLWATAIGMEGNAVQIELPAPTAIELRLSPGKERSVRVLNADGEPVAGAWVEQFCVGALDRAYSDPWKVAAAQSYRRISLTDAAGNPEIPFYSSTGSERIRAWREGIYTETWREGVVDDGARIELILSSSFTCYGVVNCNDPTIDLSRLVIDAWAMGERPTGSMSAVKVRADGSWGPMEVPARAGWEFSLSMNGPGVASDEASVGRPTPGQTIRRDFQAEPELRIPLRVVDDQSAPIAGAQCMAYWENESSGVASHGTTDSEGRVELLGIRPGWIQISVEAKGYSSHQGEWTQFVAPISDPVEIEVFRARRIAGRVMRDGKPVENFKIIWWTAQSILSSETWELDVVGSKDGEFEHDTAPRQTVWLMASADGSSRSGFLRSEPDSEAEVVLELLPSCRATGRVVDAIDGESIAGSTVQLYMNRGNQYLLPRQAPVVVDAQGRFELEDLAPGDNRLVVEAPGYSRYLGVAFASPDRVADIGSIAMQRTRSLDLVLVSDALVEFNGYSATLKGTRYQGPIPFGADGVARFEDVSPGIVTWEVRSGAGFFRREIHVLQPDVEWAFEVDLDTGPLLEIQIVPTSGKDLPRGIEVRVFGPYTRGLNVPAIEMTTWTTADEDGRAFVRGLRPGPVSIEAFSADGTEGAAASGTLDHDGSRIEVAWTMHPHTFRVIDSAGRGVSEADVFLCTPDGGSTWNRMDATDSSGETTFYVFPQDDLLVGVKHPELGMLPARPLRLSEESGTTILRYGDVAGLDLLLLEGGAPSPGTQVSLFTGGFRFVVGDIASDGEGRLRWPNLAEGTYSMRVLHPGFWPGHALVPTATGDEPTPVTIHRTGSAVLRLVAGASAPLAGQALELEHIGLGEGPAQWAALGLLQSAATVSDGQGRIPLEAWPRGTYRWRAERSDGTIASGEFELAVGANPEIELRIP